MRVAVVCPYDLGRHGGVQDQAIGLCTQLRERGHEAVLVGPGVDVPEGAVGLGRTRTVKTNRSTAPIAADPRVVSALRMAIEGVDVVHIHEPLVPVVGPAALHGSAAPIVATFHADPSRLVRRTYRLAGPALRRLLARAAVVTAVSPVAASAIDHFARARIIPNGVAVGGYPTGPKQAGTIVFLGRDDPRKGLDVLLAAWPEIRAGHPGAALEVIGAERAEDHPGVRFHGPVGEAVKRELLATAAIYAAPNTQGESFGITLVEAMAAGCAVVASALPAFARVLGGAGTLVPPGEPGALAEAILTLLDDADRLALLGVEARERARAFDWAVVADAYLGAYDDALRTPR